MKEKMGTILIIIALLLLFGFFYPITIESNGENQEPTCYSLFGKQVGC